MSYDNFKNKVSALANAANVSVRFSYDSDKGRFFANCSDGTTIIGHPSGHKMTVRWGSGHQQMINA